MDNIPARDNNGAMDNLAVLLQPDCDDVTAHLQHRFHHNHLYTGLGDFIVATRPVTEGLLEENSPQTGHKYCNSNLTPSLPPHVFALAHRVYSDVMLCPSPEPRTIFIAGAAGSGKTEVSEMVLAQLFREAKVGQDSSLPHIIMRGMQVLKRLTTIKSVSGPESSLATPVVTLYLDRTGALRTAKVTSHLLRSYDSTPHQEGKGYPNIFYDVVAGMTQHGAALSEITRDFRGLQELAPLMSLKSEDIIDHNDQWARFVSSLRYLNCGQSSSTPSQTDAPNSVVDVILALALLISLKFNLDPASGSTIIVNGDLLRYAALCLGLQPQHLCDVITGHSDGQGPRPPGSGPSSRDQLVKEIYDGLVKWFVEELNRRLPPVKQDYVPVHIADLPCYDDRPAGSLETLCQNVTHERVQQLLNDVLWLRERDVRKAQGLKPLAGVRTTRCDEVVDLALAASNGLLDRLEALMLQPTLSDQALVTTLDKVYKARKKVYTCSKSLGPTSFALSHSHGQVIYTVNPMFRQENFITVNWTLNRLLATATNPTVRDIVIPRAEEQSSAAPMTTFFLTRKTQVQLTRLLDQLAGTTPYIIRCINPNRGGPAFDQGYVTRQVDSGYIPDVCHHKKFHFSHWMSFAEFLTRYSPMVYPLTSPTPPTPQSCQTILELANIAHKGTATSKSSVFLLYWHKEKLDAMMVTYISKLTLVQARVRGHQARRRFKVVVAARIRDMHRSRNVAQTKQDDLGEHLIAQTLDRLGEISNAWAKIIALEEGTQLVKVYASELSLLVTGSQSYFDEIELGLGNFYHKLSLRQAGVIINRLRDGVELRRDSDGSLLVRRQCDLPIIAKCFGRGGFLSADLIRHQGLIPSDTFVKLLDMQEFQSLIRLEMKQKTFRKENLYLRCILGLTLGCDTPTLTEAPCWIAVVSIAALELLHNDKDLQALSLMTSQLALEQSEDKELIKLEQEEAKQRTQRTQWSKKDHRPQLMMKDQNGRKIREELRKRGEKISDHMKYSWEEDTSTRAAINMDQLYERMRDVSMSPDSSGSSTPSKQWARVDVALREVTRELSKAE